MQAKFVKGHEVMLELVRKSPGITAAELSVRTGRNRTAVRSLLGELDGEFVRKGDKRDCRVTGQLAVTWWPKGEDDAS